MIRYTVKREKKNEWVKEKNREEKNRGIFLKMLNCI